MQRPTKMSPAGRQYLKDKEAWRSVAYQDEKGVWTIGWGFTRGVKKGDTMTMEEGELRLTRELDGFERAVVRGIKDAPTTQGQFDMFVSLCYNIGSGDPTKIPPIAGFLTSTVLKQHIAGNYLAASRAFGLWNQVTVVVNGKKVKRESKGLTNRRREEGSKYLTASEFPKPVEEVVYNAVGTAEVDPHAEDATPDGERNVGNSQIAVATKIGGATTAIAAGSEVVSQVAYAKRSVDDLLTLPNAIYLIFILVIAGLLYYIWKQRKKQRDEGWA